MKIRIISIGKAKDRFLKEGEALYLPRLRRETELDCLEINPSPGPGDTRARDSGLVLRQIDSRDFLVVLDERGQQRSSREFAAFLERHMVEATPRLVFAIGGPCGWDDEVRRRANLVLSFSSLTFPYQLARLVLLEQLFRAFSIIRGTPYHRE